MAEEQLLLSAIDQFNRFTLPGIRIVQNLVYDQWRLRIADKCKKM
jgi:hypothetical protein